MTADQMRENLARHVEALGWPEAAKIIRETEPVADEEPTAPADQLTLEDAA